MAKFEITWEAPEFEYHEKDVSWYWITIIIAAIVVAFSVWTRNFLFGFFIVVAELLFIVWGNQKPRIMQFELTDDAVRVGPHKHHAMKEFESWSTDAAEDGHIDIYFYFRSRVKAPLKILAPADKLEQIRANLKTVLKEIEHESTLLDAIEKLLRF